MKQFAGWVTDWVKKKKSKLGFKIFLGVFISLAFTFLICFITLNLVFLRLHEKEFTEHFMNLFSKFSFQFEQSSKEDLEDLVFEFGRENQANVTVADPGNFNEVIFQYTYWEDLEEDNAIHSDWIGVTDARTGIGFVLYAATSREKVNKMVAPIQSMTPLLILIALSISFIISIGFAIYLARPIVRMSDMSRRLKILDLNHSYEIKRADEIGELAYNLNHMARRLNQSVTDLSDANEKLQSDVEQKKKEEEQRSDLFTAISHELKTPLTILKGELKGMIDEISIYQDRDYYLKHAYKITERLEALIQQILLVSRLDAAEKLFHSQIISISDLISDLCHDYEEIAQQKNIFLTYYCEEKLIIKANSIQLKHVISNVINNAIFHSPVGELVNIQCVSSKAKGIFTVENTGVSIPEEELKNIFEPFYRTDKSRSRYTGGSGLGLYIVKRILELHHFSYQIENTAEGVLFTLTFPLFD